MKNILIIIATAVSSMAYSQVIIGDAVGTVPTGQKTSVLLEFAKASTADDKSGKGIILPYVRTLPTSGAARTEGTILLDATDPTNATVKFYNGGTRNDGWHYLNANKTASIGTSYLAAQPTETQVTEGANAKTIIGATSSAADGVLVLESSDKAMVLPMVNSVNEINQAAAGMMVYVNKAGAKRLAVFNGKHWVYWAPAP